MKHGSRKVYVVCDGYFPQETVVTGYFTNRLDAEKETNRLNIENMTNDYRVMEIAKHEINKVEQVRAIKT